MKAFYSRLKKADQMEDARLAKLAKVCSADLSEILANNALDPWSWWTGE